MKKFNITYYDLFIGYLYDETLEFENYESAEKYAINSINNDIEKAKRNFEKCNEFFEIEEME